MLGVVAALVLLLAGCPGPMLIACVGLDGCWTWVAHVTHVGVLRMLLLGPRLPVPALLQRMYAWCTVLWESLCMTMICNVVVLPSSTSPPTTLLRGHPRLLLVLPLLPMVLVELLLLTLLLGWLL